jgi:dihydrodipicolinate synthase/N-acetylneuraminate lyase
MSNIQERFSGLFIPHVTPFNDSGALDLESLSRLTAHFVALDGVAGLVSCARIGEGPVLNLEEKRAVYEAAGKAARAAGKLHVATIAPQSTDEAISLMRGLEDLPVDAVMIFPPLLFAWGKVDPNLKVRFFEDLARETKLPVVLFQVPVKSYYYEAETVCRIARLENVAAFKEASFDINLFNVATERWGALDAAGRAGDFDHAAAMQRELHAVKELVFSEPIVEAVARIKVVLHHEGLIKSATVRRPQLGITETEQKQLLDSYRALKANEFRPAETEAKRRQAIG